MDPLNEFLEEIEIPPEREEDKPKDKYPAHLYPLWNEYKNRPESKLGLVQKSYLETMEKLNELCDLLKGKKIMGFMDFEENPAIQKINEKLDRLSDATTNICFIKNISLENITIDGITIGKMSINDLSINYAINTEKEEVNPKDTQKQRPLASEISDSDAKELMNFINWAKEEQENDENEK